jgi:hypothetical protein
MQGGHCLILDIAAETITHHQVRPGVQPLYETGDVAEIVTVIGVRHEDILTTRGQNPALQGVAVSLLSDVYDARAFCLGNLD